MFTLSSSTMLNLVNAFNNINAQLVTSNLRLSTGKRVNYASDDPSAIIANSRFASQIAKIDAETANAQRISSILDTADGAMSEISTLLTSIQSDVIAASGGTVTAEERNAYQQSIDESIDAIDRLVNTTSFDGTRLLDGTSGYDTTGVDSTDITALRVDAVNSDSGTYTAALSVTASTVGTISYNTGWVDAGGATITITGPDGSESLVFAGGAGKQAVTDAINAETGTTGIVAEYAGGGAPVYFKTQDYGDEATVSVTVTAGIFEMVDSITSDTGSDAVVTLNGSTATVDGKEVYANHNGTMMKFSLTDTMNQTGGTSSFTITGDGAGWQIDGTAAGQIHFGVSSMLSSNLGNGTYGFLSTLASGGTNALSTGNYTTADNIVDFVVDRVATERSRVGSLKTNTVTSAINAVADTRTALATAQSNIMDIDTAAETAENSRLQALAEVTATIIAAMNTNQNNVLVLLGLGR